MGAFGVDGKITVPERVLLTGQYRGRPHGLGHGGLPHNVAVTAGVTEGPVDADTLVKEKF